MFSCDDFYNILGLNEMKINRFSINLHAMVY